MRILCAIIASAFLLGCANSPKPAKSEVEGGNSRLTSERREDRPSKQRMVITVDHPPPTFIIRITEEK